MSEDAQVRAPFSERVVTDYSKLTPEYVEYLQQKAEQPGSASWRAKRRSHDALHDHRFSSPDTLEDALAPGPVHSQQQRRLRPASTAPTPPEHERQEQADVQDRSTARQHQEPPERVIQSVVSDHDVADDDCDRDEAGNDA